MKAQEYLNSDFFKALSTELKESNKAAEGLDPRLGCNKDKFTRCDIAAAAWTAARDTMFDRIKGA